MFYEKYNDNYCEEFDKIKALNLVDKPLKNSYNNNILSKEFSNNNSNEKDLNSEENNSIKYLFSSESISIESEEINYNSFNSFSFLDCVEDPFISDKKRGQIIMKILLKSLVI